MRQKLRYNFENGSFLFSKKMVLKKIRIVFGKIGFLKMNITRLSDR